MNLRNAPALHLSLTPVYLATAQPLDDEFRHRVKLHQLRRGPEWTNIEEQLYPADYELSSRTVLVDCVTMWATNIFFHCDEDIDRSLEMFRNEFDRLIAIDATFIFVTNEIGLGGTSENAMQRRFTDLLGFVNRACRATCRRRAFSYFRNRLKNKIKQMRPFNIITPDNSIRRRLSTR